MGSTFKIGGVSHHPFDSGPHRFHLGPIGEDVQPLWRIVGPGTPGSVAVGPLELRLIVTGRLVADNEAGLWTLRNAIAALLTDPPQVGNVVDHWGTTWTTMSFVRFEQTDRTDRGRKTTLGYVAEFIRFL